MEMEEKRINELEAWVLKQKKETFDLVRGGGIGFYSAILLFAPVWVMAILGAGTCVVVLISLARLKFNPKKW